MKGILPEYQIISIYINRLTYRQILYQALAKLSETTDIDQLVADNKISVALTDKKEPGVSPIDPTHAKIDDECLPISPPYILYIFHLAAIERNAFTVLVSPKRPQLVVPEKLPDTVDKPNHFSNWLYNFIIDMYVQHGLSVRKEQQDKLYNLTLSIHNVLLHFYNESKLPSGCEVPSQFMHALQCSDNQDRVKTTQST